jgi:uncharacterized protein (TIGR02246 family)
MAAPTKPEDCDRLFAEHVNAGDVAAALFLYEPGGCFVTRDGAAVGADAIRPQIERLVASKGRLVCRVTRVVSAGDDLTLLYNDWTITLPDGGTRTGRALELVRRQPDGTWRFVIDDPYGRR